MQRLTHPVDELVFGSPAKLFEFFMYIQQSYLRQIRRINSPRKSCVERVLGPLAQMRTQQNQQCFASQRIAASHARDKIIHRPHRVDFQIVCCVARHSIIGGVLADNALQPGNSWNSRMTSDLGERDDSPDDKRFAVALQEYYCRLALGPVDPQAFATEFPSVHDELLEYFAAVEDVRATVEGERPFAPLHNYVPPDSPPPLDTIRYFDDYELLSEIARGGMGVVYLARQVSLNRIVAVKMILAGRLASEEDVARFYHEARGAASLQHPHVVAIYEVGEHDGQYYFSMEYVEGTNLAQLVRDNPLGSVAAAEYARTIAETMDAIHQRGLLHRDLKPSNVLLEKASGRVRITDFGLAKSTISEGMFTMTGQVLGTPSYLPPEQAAGENHRVGPSSDIYAIGAILYELVTGRPPFLGETPWDTVWQVRNSEVVVPRSLNPKIPRDLETICLKCLQKETHRRYATAQHLADDLGRFLRGEPVLARPVRLLERVWRWSRRNPAASIAIGAVTIGVLAVVASIVVSAQTRATSAERARQSQKRQSLMLQSQAMLNSERSDGWSKKAWDLASRAAAIERDQDLRNQAASILLGGDATAVQTFEQYGARRVLFDPTGRRVLFGSVVDAQQKPLGAKLWNVESREVLDLPTAGDGPIGFRSDGTPLQVAVRPDNIGFVILDLSRAETVTTFSLPAEMTLSGVDRMAITEDGSKVAAAAVEDGRIAKLLVWDGATGDVVQSLPGPVHAIGFTSDGSLLGAVDDLEATHIWSVRTGKELRVLPAAAAQIHCLAFARDRQTAGSSATDIEERGWLLASGEAGGTVTIRDLAARIPRSYCRGSYYDIFAVSFSPDGVTLASAGRGETHLWDVATGRHVLSLQAGDFTTGLAFSPDGRRLATSSLPVFFPPRTTIWELQKGSTGCEYRGLTGQVAKTYFSPDGNQIAALSHDWKIAVWDQPTGFLRHVFSAPQGLVADNSSIAFSPDHRRIAFSTLEAAVLWDDESGQELRRWPQPPGLQDTLVFDDRGRLLSCRVETEEGKLGPLSDAPPRQHPRVCRIRDLLASDPTASIAEIRDFNWHVFGIAAAPDGSYFVIDGRGGSYGEHRLLKVFDPTGKQLLDIPSRPVESHFASLAIDPVGNLLAALTDDTRQATLWELPSGTLAGRLPELAASISAGGKFWGRCGNSTEGGRGFLVYAHDSQRPVVGFDMERQITIIQPSFSRTGSLVAWGNDVGTVYVCDLRELQRKLSELQLQW